MVSFLNYSGNKLIILNARFFSGGWVQDGEGF